MEELTAYLWDLRAFLERQTRCIAAIQPLVEAVSQASPIDRMSLKRDIVRSLLEVQEISYSVRDSAASAIVATAEGEPNQL